MATKLITREGFERLEKELDHLWRVERPEITRKVTWAASLGDRSENADYQYNKKRLREIDRRVRYLRKCLEYRRWWITGLSRRAGCFSAPGWRSRMRKGASSGSGSSVTTRSSTARTTSPSTRPWRGRC